MSLPLLVVIVVIGIAAIVAAVHFSGGSARRALSSGDEAINRFRIDFPEADVDGVWLANDGETAFLSIDTGRLGFVQSVGARFLTRIVVQKDIRSMELRDGARLSIRFNDFTYRGGLFRFADQASARAVLDLLAQLKPGGEAYAAK